MSEENKAKWLSKIAAIKNEIVSYKSDIQAKTAQLKKLKDALNAAKESMKAGADYPG